MEKNLKGGAFRNRYLIRATLTATAPFHIGSGDITTREEMVDEAPDGTKTLLKISAVVTDGSGTSSEEGKAYIPGSSMRGAIREWLNDTFKGMEERLASDEVKRKIAALQNLDTEQKQMLYLVANESSPLERLFGSQYNEGKVEVWDALCTSTVITPSDVNLSGWNRNRMTYVAKSVAIDPTTGTVDGRKLYNFELVPEGATFDATFTAQNLDESELEILLAVLQGFNDPDNPITLGSMSNRGFGTFTLSLPKIYKLDELNIATWEAHAHTKPEASYDLIAHKDFAIPRPKGTTIFQRAEKRLLMETWNLTLETPMVIRSGSKFGWRNASHSKTRNHKMRFRWGRPKDNLHEIGDLYFTIRLEGKEAKPCYHVPSSSIRGALRNWTIRNLLPMEQWDIEEYLKNPGVTVEDTMGAIIDLFGFAVDAADEEMKNRFTRAGRLRIKTKPFSTDAEKPAMQGTWDSSNWDGGKGNEFGPGNAARHVKPRNPLDRATHAAREEGLHNFLEFSAGEKFSVVIEIKEPKKDFDEQLLKLWKKEIDYGIITFGGLWGVGRGRISIVGGASNG